MSITNTSKHRLCEHWLMGGNPDAIVQSERNGQKELIHTDALPVKGSEDPNVVALGITWGPPVVGDEIFREATLPEGWTKRATEHPMWSELLDDHGVVRASIFYKAAFYDRRAFICVQ